MFRFAAVGVLFFVGCSRTPESQSAATRDVAARTPPQTQPVATSSAAPEPHTPDSSAERREASAPVAKQEAAAAVTPLPADPSFRYPGAERVVAIGDLHGDLASTREALRLAGAIDAADRWAGGKLVLVQVGDQLDRGDDEPQILQLLERLTQEAKAAGGAVYVLNGNHELMNASGDLRYVTQDGFRDYAAVPPPQTAHVPAGIPPEAQGRFAAFTPGSELAKKLADRNTIAIVGDTVFAHAGVLHKHVRYGISRINEEVRSFLRGEVATLPPTVAAEDAPVWTRLYGGPNPGAEVCAELSAVLDALSVKRMVVGHTVQSGGITSACDGRLYRVDVGLSDYYGTNPTQVLELRGGAAKVLPQYAP